MLATLLNLSNTEWTNFKPERCLSSANAHTTMEHTLRDERAPNTLQTAAAPRLGNVLMTPRREAPVVIEEGTKFNNKEG